MRDDFEIIRAERDVAIPRAGSVEKQRYSGLWKQIALGIVVGYSVLGLLGAAGWWIALQLALGGLQISTH